MAKGGSGDILTGIVAAMLGQYPGDVAAAVEAAVFLQGLPGIMRCERRTSIPCSQWIRRAPREAFRAHVKDSMGLRGSPGP